MNTYYHISYKRLKDIEDTYAGNILFVALQYPNDVSLTDISILELNMFYLLLINLTQEDLTYLALLGIHLAKETRNDVIEELDREYTSENLSISIYSPMLKTSVIRGIIHVDPRNTPDHIKPCLKGLKI